MIRRGIFLRSVIGGLCYAAKSYILSANNQMNNGQSDIADESVDKQTYGAESYGFNGVLTCFASKF